MILQGVLRLRSARVQLVAGNLIGLPAARGPVTGQVMHIATAADVIRQDLIFLSPIAQTVTQCEIVVPQQSHNLACRRVYESVRMSQDDVGAICHEPGIPRKTRDRQRTCLPHLGFAVRSLLLVHE